VAKHALKAVFLRQTAVPAMQLRLGDHPVEIYAFAKRAETSMTSGVNLHDLGDVSHQFLPKILKAPRCAVGWRGGSRQAENFRVTKRMFF
jgi:hypothetical protein